MTTQFPNGKTFELIRKSDAQWLARVPLPETHQQSERLLKRYNAVRRGLKTSMVILPAASLTEDKTAIDFVIPRGGETVSSLEVSDCMDAYVIARALGTMRLRANSYRFFVGKKMLTCVPDLVNCEHVSINSRNELAYINEETVSSKIYVELKGTETGLRAVVGDAVVGYSGLNGKYYVPSRIELDGEVFAKRSADKQTVDEEWTILDADKDTIDGHDITILPVYGSDAVPEYVEHLFEKAPLGTPPLYTHFGANGQYYIVVDRLYVAKHNTLARYVAYDADKKMVSGTGFPLSLGWQQKPVD